MEREQEPRKPSGRNMEVELELDSDEHSRQHKQHVQMYCGREIDCTYVNGYLV